MDKAGTESALATRISITSYIETISEQQCEQLLHVLKDELGCKTMNEFLIKILSQQADNGCFTQDVLYQVKQEAIKLYDQGKENNKSAKCAAAAQSQPTPKSLTKLPGELLSQIGLMLDKKDVISYEQCCRDFYCLINQASFITNNDNYKQFTIDSKMISKINDNQPKGLFKYSHVEKINLDVDCGLTFKMIHENDCYGDFLKQYQSFKSEFNTIVKNHKIDSIFKSVKTIEFRNDGIIFIDLLPADILFNSNVSKLQNLVINDPMLVGYCHGCYTMNGVWSPYGKFGRKYKDLEQKFDHLLNCVTFTPIVWEEDDESSSTEISNYYHNCFNIQHLWLFDRSINLDYFTKGQSCHPNLTKVTIEGDAKFIGTGAKNGIATSDDEQQANITSIRFLHVDKPSVASGWGHWRQSTWQQMFNGDESYPIIEAMNLNNTLKNITFVLQHKNINETMLKILNNIIKRTYFPKTENISILVTGQCESEKLINVLFGLLKENVNAVQQKFYHQFNIGIRCIDSTTNKNVCLLFDAADSQNISVNVIDGIRKQWLKSATDNENVEYYPNVEKFDQLKDQWFL